MVIKVCQFIICINQYHIVWKSSNNYCVMKSINDVWWFYMPMKGQVLYNLLWVHHYSTKAFFLLLTIYMDGSDMYFKYVKRQGLEDFWLKAHLTVQSGFALCWGGAMRGHWQRLVSTSRGWLIYCDSTLNSILIIPINNIK